jgi:hypothetical protein
MSSHEDWSEWLPTPQHASPSMSTEREISIVVTVFALVAVEVLAFGAVMIWWVS